MKNIIPLSKPSDFCIEWRGPRNHKGYGIVSKSGGTVHICRLILQGKLGRYLREDEVSMHACDNPSCVNPTHLYVGSALENNMDAIAKGRRAPRINLRRTTDDDIRRVIALSKTGMPQLSIAMKLDLDAATVNKIVNGKMKRAVAFLAEEA